MNFIDEFCEHVLIPHKLASTVWMDYPDRDIQYKVWRCLICSKKGTVERTKQEIVEERMAARQFAIDQGYWK